MKRRIVAGKSLAIAYFAISIFSICCHNYSKKAEKMNIANISQSADSLSEYFPVPSGSECKWLVKPMGEMNTRVPGPTDYELFAMIRFPDNAYIEQLAADCPAIDEMDDGIPIDTQIYSLFGMETIPGGKQYNGKMVQAGRAIDLDTKIKHPLSNGIGLIINPTLLFITASTF